MIGEKGKIEEGREGNIGREGGREKGKGGKRADGGYSLLSSIAN